MNAENQKKILDTVSRVLSGVASALGREPLSYEDGIRFIRDHGNKTLFEISLEVIKKTVPIVGQEQNLTPEAIPIFLDAMDTEKKAEELLSRFPDPNPIELEKKLHQVDLFLPSVRKVLAPFAKGLPQDPGGHPRKISEQDEPRVREEVAQLFNEGYSLPAAKKEVAHRRGASLSTIQRICRRGTVKQITLEVIEED